VLHRDLKSQNILIDAGLHARIADFGKLFVCQYFFLVCVCVFNVEIALVCHVHVYDHICIQLFRQVYSHTYSYINMYVHI